MTPVHSPACPTAGLPGGARGRGNQQGVVAVEFALIATVLFVVLVGAIEMGRLLWVWNSATEATRAGARLAVVCEVNAPGVARLVTQRVPGLATANVRLSYTPSGCTSANCEAVTVAVVGYTPPNAIPLPAFTPTLPAFSTTLARESLSNTTNPACQ